MAQTKALELTWTAPSTCPTETEVETAVSKNAATQTAETEDQPTLFAQGVVTQRTGQGSDSAWHVLLQTVRGGVRGEREITAESCAALAEATAVVLSLALLNLTEDPPVAPAPASSNVSDPSDPNATSRGARGPATEESPGVESRPVESRRADEAPSRRQNPVKKSQRQTGPRSKSEEPSQRGRKRAPQQSASKPHQSLAHFALHARGGLNTGTLPRPTLGGALGASWVPGAFRLELGAQMWQQQSEVVDDTPAGAELSLQSIGARACLRALGSKRLSLSPCVGSEFHLLRAEGFGSDSNYKTTATWPALAGGLLGVVRLTSLVALRADVEGRAALAQPRLFVERLGTVHEIPRLSFTTLFGAEVYFP